MSTTTTSTPLVRVVLVCHNSGTKLARTLAAIDSLRYPNRTLTVVDNASSDGTTATLLERFAPEQLIVTEQNVGFGLAVTYALDSQTSDPDELVLLLHDDLELAPDALDTLVDALVNDPRLGAVGPKLLDWHDPHLLHSLGWTIDLTGRADNDLDPGELDQGQRDLDSATLFVSTAGMLVRRSALEAIGGFDGRYHAFRDDLDVCWRLWLYGYSVEVVPQAIGHHDGITDKQHDVDHNLSVRFLTERNALVTLLKNYTGRRLFFVLFLYTFFAAIKIAGFLLTRRFSDATDMLRAIVWNIRMLPDTLRLRRTVQQQRVRSDRELTGLFGRIVPRLQSYLEALGAWIGGSSDPAKKTAPQVSFTNPIAKRAWRFAAPIVTRPTRSASVVLAALFVVSVWPLLTPGVLRGGEFAPWPANAAAFFAAYASGWNDAGAFGTSQTPSPAQAILGMLQLATFNSGAVAARMALLLPLVLAWIFALRLAQQYSQRRPARVVAATAYVLSPPVVAALTQGRLSALVVFAALPALVLVGLSLTRPPTTAVVAWRSVAAAALIAALAGAFEPLILLLFLFAGVATLVLARVRITDKAWRRALTIRVSVAAFAPFVLLFPWSIEVFATGAAFTPGEAYNAAAWQWMLFLPVLPGLSGVIAGTGFLLAGVLGFALGVQRAARLVYFLWSLALAGVVLAWLLDRLGGPAWPGIGLMVTAGAFAGLFAVAFANAQIRLSQHAFGWRQVAAGLAVLGVSSSIALVATELLTDPLDAFHTTDSALPSYIKVAAENEPFRALVLKPDATGVAWDVAQGSGVTMTAYGVPLNDAARQYIASAVQELVESSNPSAATRLGEAGIRFIVIPPDVDQADLIAALSRQRDAEPRPVTQGAVYAITTWQPIAVVGRPADGDDPATWRPLQAQNASTYVGAVGSDEQVRIAEFNDGLWTASGLAGETRSRTEPLVQFLTLDAGEVRIRHLGGTTRGLTVAGQLFALLLTISLALRPPQFARSYPHAQPLARQDS